MSRVWQLFGKGEQRDEPPPAPPPSPPEEISGVLDTYRVPAGGDPDSSAQVFVVEEDGLGKYLVRSPSLSAEESRALELLRANLLDSIPAEAAGDRKDIVSEYISRSAEEMGTSGVVEGSKEKLLYYLLRDFAGFWEVDPLVNDDSLE